MGVHRINGRFVGRLAGLTAAYVVVARLGLMVDPVNGFATLVWPSTGLALAALLLQGSSLWPGVWLGAFAVNCWAGAPWPAAVGIATGNALEAVIGAYALRRWAGFDGSFDRLRQVVGLLLQAPVSALVSATFGVASLAFAGAVNTYRFAETWQAWWVGDMLGAIVIAPLVLIAARPPRWTVTLPRLVEGLVAALGLVVASLAIFLRRPGATYSPFLSPYMLFPLFVWVALRFELPGSVTATALVSALAVWGTTKGLGPFLRDRLAGSLLALQTFMGCAAATPLVVGAALSDRARAIRDREHLVTRFQTLATASRSFAEANMELPDLLDRIGQQVVEVLGDSCVVRMLTENQNRAEVVSVHHINPQALALLRQMRGERGEIATDSAVSRALLSGRSYLRPVSLDEGFRASVSPNLRPYLDRFGVRSILAAPLRDHTRIIGSVTATRTYSSRSYTVEDQSLLEELSDRASLAIGSARLHDDLKVAVRARDDFLAVASHELKTPLAATLLQLQSLQRAFQKDSAPARLEERIDKAASSGIRLQRLVNELLDVSRITAGKLHLEPEPVNLSQVVSEVVAQFRDVPTSMFGGSIVLRCPEKVAGRWDRSRMEQVVNNLVANGLKYGQKKPVEVEVAEEDGEAVLRVMDHGIGIDDDHRKKIFQKFERAVAVRDFGGFGLGLWITRQIVESSGGRIDVQSATGQGSTFTVRLPVAPNGVASEVPPCL